MALRMWIVVLFGFLLILGACSSEGVVGPELDQEAVLDVSDYQVSPAKADSLWCYDPYKKKWVRC